MILVQVELTHAVLTAASRRQPGHPPDACDGEVIPLRLPEGTESTLSLWACKDCYHRIVTRQRPGSRREIVNEYPGGEIRPEELPPPPTAAAADVLLDQLDKALKSPLLNPRDRPAGRKSRKA